MKSTVKIVRAMAASVAFGLVLAGAMSYQKVQAQTGNPDLTITQVTPATGNRLNIYVLNQGNATAKANTLRVVDIGLEMIRALKQVPLLPPGQGCWITVDDCPTYPPRPRPWYRITADCYNVVNELNEYNNAFVF